MRRPSGALSEDACHQRPLLASVSVGGVLRALVTWRDDTPASSRPSCRASPVLSQSPFGIRRHKAESLLALVVSHRHLG